MHFQIVTVINGTIIKKVSVKNIINPCTEEMLSLSFIKQFFTGNAFPLEDKVSFKFTRDAQVEISTESSNYDIISTCKENYNFHTLLENFAQ